MRGLLYPHFVLKVSQDLQLQCGIVSSTLLLLNESPWELKDGKE